MAMTLAKPTMLSKVVYEADISLLDTVDESYFTGFEQEYKFIRDYYNKHKAVPTPSEYFSKFINSAIIEEDTKKSPREYLLEALIEQKTFETVLPSIIKYQESSKLDAVKALEDLLDSLKKVVPNKNKGIDIIKSASKRLKAHETKDSKSFIGTGLEELDVMLGGGFSPEEELVVLVARTGHGKSWLLVKMAISAWKQDTNVGYISPEMTADKIGYRFDALYGGFSNSALNHGIKLKGYGEYINQLEGSVAQFIVARPNEFDNNLTVSKLRRFAEKEKLGFLAIDGLNYLSDERAKPQDNKTTKLTNISEDLMALSVELKIPVVIVVQANRMGVRIEEGTPDLENIRDSDGISHNATKVISIKKEKTKLEVAIKKNRDGISDGSLKYTWEADTGKFTYIPCSPAPAPAPEEQDTKKTGKDKKGKDKTGKDKTRTEKYTDIEAF
jgi:hypothetical protein